MFALYIYGLFAWSHWPIYMAIVLSCYMAYIYSLLFCGPCFALYICLFCFIWACLRLRFALAYIYGPVLRFVFIWPYIWPCLVLSAIGLQGATKARIFLGFALFALLLALSLYMGLFVALVCLLLYMVYIWSALAYFIACCLVLCLLPIFI